MNIKKPLLVAGVASSVTLASLAGTHIASAAESSTTNSDPQSTLISKIASKFNLSQNEVKAVFEADRSAREAEHQKQVETDLSKLVSEGKLTEAQKDAILAKRAELQKERDANRDTMKNMSESERKQHMDSERDSLKKWAEQNNISEDYLRYVFGGPGGPGGGGPRH